MTVSNTHGPHTMDFVLKIMTINGKKERIQIWDMAGGLDPASTLAPLFIRNAVGCVIVAHAENQRSIKEAAKWRNEFNGCT